MVKIRGFKALRPRRDLAEKIASLPYDVMSSEEARKMIKNNPYSFLHVDKAEIDLDENIYKYDKVVYEKAKENLNNMINKGYLIEDSKNCMYIYKQTMDERSQTGLVVCCSIDDYINNNIKKHEHTRYSKEEDRINHVNYCEAQTGPIFLTYEAKEQLEEIEEIINKQCKNEPIYNFITDDKVHHEIWIIDNYVTIKELINKFTEVENLYIADGHHRAASAVYVGEKRRERSKNYSGDEEFNYFLGVIFPHSQLNIIDYNRVIKGLNGLTKEEFLDKLEEGFYVKKMDYGNKYKPKERNCFGMYLNNEWYELKCKCDILYDLNVIELLDVSILQNNILSPILGITNPREDNRIDFVGGIRGLDELERRVSNDMTVAFTLYPTSITEIINIADKGNIMPPKSTWFEPKLRSGLFIHKI